MAELQEYKCLNCGGGLAFNSTAQQLKCPYCETVIEMSAMQGYDDALQNESPSEMRWETKPDAEWQAGELEGMRVFGCQSCGGEIIGDANTAATSCPYCNNPIVVTGQLAGDLRPDCIVPFQYDKEAAKHALKAHFKGKTFLPPVFKSESRVDEIQGIYVPFWLFDTDVNANIRYRAEKIRRWSDERYDYKEKSVYLVYRKGNLGFENVPVDGSTKMPDDMMESVEPYDCKAAVDFKTAYLAGYLADKYDIDASASIARANARVTKSTEDSFAATVKGYSAVKAEYSRIELTKGAARYALLPVWILNVVWRGTKYVFAVNGQTGKIVGDLPFDKSAYWRWVLMLFPSLAAAFFVIQLILGIIS